MPGSNPIQGNYKINDPRSPTSKMVTMNKTNSSKNKSIIGRIDKDAMKSKKVINFDDSSFEDSDSEIQNSSEGNQNEEMLSEKCNSYNNYSLNVKEEK